ncbi:hypothetical protein [Streptomyces xanthochromogenes]|uniref:Aromatic ring-opening dioxygenase LigA n=1 Tax=Streptomyces xanthochromogenes TaxID=67384 RepID=A0ABQ3AB73_9ACTN|nr:hypothetical protein [Streptomyces xanthochromogenes]GGY44821.1 hypothetical protein GCM10010326_43560 [Streptomyces xanthochromogenes]
MPLTTPRRAALRTVAVTACLPYLCLKAAWIGGSHLGIPEHSGLRDHSSGMAAANIASILLDSCVIALALLLTRPWGLRVKTWLLALPMWVATGLLAPVMTGYPLQLLLHACGSAAGPAAPGSAPFLDTWVFAVVYAGFIVQGLALGTLFTLYARDRWGHLLRGRTGELPSSGAAPRTAAVVTAVLSLLPAAAHLVWATGSGRGLTPALAAGRTTDDYALEAVFAVFALVGAAGALMTAFGLGRSLPLRLPLALAWLGSGATACWGGWLWLSALLVADRTADGPTATMGLTYAVQMVTGTLIVVMGIRFFAERAHQVGRTP